MSMAELVPLVLRGSILAIVFSIGLGARPRDLIGLLRQPARLAVSLLAMMVIMPALALALVKAMHLPVPIAIMLVALSLAPVPPVLPRKLNKANANAAYGVGLLVAAGLTAIVWIPLAMEMVERLFAVPLDVPPAAVAGLVAKTILAPLAVGVVAALLIPKVAARLQPIVSALGGVLLLGAAALIIFSQWHAMAGLLHDGTLPAIAIFILVGLAVGHLLGGPDPDDRTVLALATSSRHPGIALAIAHINFPNQKALIAAVLLFLVVNALLSIPYVTWRKRAGASRDAA